MDIGLLTNYSFLNNLALLSVFCILILTFHLLSQTLKSRTFLDGNNLWLYFTYYRFRLILFFVKIFFPIKFRDSDRLICPYCFFDFSRVVFWRNRCFWGIVDIILVSMWYNVWGFDEQFFFVGLFCLIFALLHKGAPYFLVLYLNIDLARRRIKYFLILRFNLSCFWGTWGSINKFWIPIIISTCDQLNRTASLHRCFAFFHWFFRRRKHLLTVLIVFYAFFLVIVMKL